MENIEFDNIISDYKKAEMVVIGLGSQMCKKAFDNMLVAIGKDAASEQQKSVTSFQASKNSRLY